MVKRVVRIARLVTIQVTTIHRAWLVVLVCMVTKLYKCPIFLAKHAHRVPIHPQRVCPVLPDAMIVPRANIQEKQEIKKYQNAKIVNQANTKPSHAKQSAFEQPLVKLLVRMVRLLSPLQTGIMRPMIQVLLLCRVRLVQSVPTHLQVTVCHVCWVNIKIKVAKRFVCLVI